jgi:prepilin-type N-terminal cleavage/methylation domain-containing protein
MKRQRGMTLVELLVALVIVMLIIGAAATSYLKLLRTYRTQGRLAETYMANLTGLEMLRYDIEMAGFGLPALLGAGASYLEAAADGSLPYDPTALNDAPATPPRAFVHLDNRGANGSDVLAIKSSAADIFNNPTGKKWSVITTGANPSIQPPSNFNPKVKQWGVTGLDHVMDFVPNEYFIVLDNSGTLQLPAGAWSNSFSASYYTNASTIAGSSNPQVVYYIYGLDNNVINPENQHRMPFNRVDYYLDNSIPGDIPSSCASDTFILYRSTVSQANGVLKKQPLVDCVKDFQVAFGLDPSGGSDPSQTIVWQQNLVGMNAGQIKQQLREVRVFVLFQEGLGDSGTTADFRSAGYFNLGDQDIANSLDPGSYPTNAFQQWSSSPLPGDAVLSRFSPTAQPDIQYRWKIIEMAIKPMNLVFMGYR